MKLNNGKTNDPNEMYNGRGKGFLFCEYVKWVSYRKNNRKAKTINECVVIDLT